MATKSGQQEPEKAEVVEELLDALDTALDRVKVLYEQYFLGIQKQPPSYLHTDVERKIRDITQIQVRNTALRYRFATLQQKFGSYNAYWRRTLRQIENGTYTRNLSKIGRQAARTGAAVPEEILAAMPKRMREQVQRDREAALALARLRDQQRADDPELLTLADEDVDIDLEDLEPTAFIHESSELRRNMLTAGGVHRVDEADVDFDVDAFFASVTSVGEPDLEDATPVFMPRMRTQSSAPRPPMSAAAPVTPSMPPPSMPPPSPDTAKPPVPIAPSASTRPRVPSAAQPLTPSAVRPPMPAPSQATRPSPVAPGASAAGAPAAVETLAGPFPRIPNLPALPNKRQPDAAASSVTVEREGASGPPPSVPAADSAAARGMAPGQPLRTTERVPPRDRMVPSSERTPAPERVPPNERPALQRPAAGSLAGERAAPGPRQGPPPGMTDADVNTLYDKYVKAKETLGEDAGPGAYSKLLKTINAQAPKIMEQYKAKGVDFSVVVKDNQVIIRAKPKR